MRISKKLTFESISVTSSKATRVNWTAISCRVAREASAGGGTSAGGLEGITHDTVRTIARDLRLEMKLSDVEYQGDTIGKYGLDFNGEAFVLTKKSTNCLAKDKCGIPAQKPKLRLSEISAAPSGACTPGSGCC